MHLHEISITIIVWLIYGSITVEEPLQGEILDNRRPCKCWSGHTQPNQAIVSNSHLAM